MDTEEIKKNLKLIDKHAIRISNNAKKLHKAVYLLNSMVEGGERHSETSRRIVREALDY